MKNNPAQSVFAAITPFFRMPRVRLSRLWRPCLCLGVVLLLTSMASHFGNSIPPPPHPTPPPPHPTRPILPYSLPYILTASHTTTTTTANVTHLRTLILPQRTSPPQKTSPSTKDVDGGLNTNKTQPPELAPPPEKRLRQPTDWPQFFQPRKHPQFSMDYPYQFRANNRTCVETPVDMVVMTLSIPKNFRERQAIRETWGSVARTGSWPGVGAHETLAQSLGVVFLLGEEREPGPNVSERLRQESERYGDIVQWKGLDDVYFNLTLKVLMGLKWVNQFCPLVSRVIKTDDDTFVHVPRLLHRLLSAPLETHNHIWGPYFANSPCERSRSKYAVSREAYPFERYPPHVKGNLYLLPGSSVSKMVATAPYLPFNNMEDVHVTGTLARVLGLGHEGFSRKEMSTAPVAPNVCLFQRSAIALASQMVSPQLHYEIWKTFSDPSLCSG